MTGEIRPQVNMPPAPTSRPARAGRRWQLHVDVGAVILVVFLAALALAAGVIVHELWPW